MFEETALCQRQGCIFVLWVVSLVSPLTSGPSRAAASLAEGPRGMSSRPGKKGLWPSCRTESIEQISKQKQRQMAGQSVASLRRYSSSLDHQIAWGAGGGERSTARAMASWGTIAASLHWTLSQQQGQDTVKRDSLCGALTPRVGGIMQPPSAFFAARHAACRVPSAIHPSRSFHCSATKIRVLQHDTCGSSQWSLEESCQPTSGSPFCSAHLLHLLLPD